MLLTQDRAELHGRLFQCPRRARSAGRHRTRRERTNDGQLRFRSTTSRGTLPHPEGAALKGVDVRVLRYPGDRLNCPGQSISRKEASCSEAIKPGARLTAGSAPARRSRARAFQRPPEDRWHRYRRGDSDRQRAGRRRDAPSCEGRGPRSTRPTSLSTAPSQVPVRVDRVCSNSSPVPGSTGECDVPVTCRSSTARSSKARSSRSRASRSH